MTEREEIHLISFKNQLSCDKNLRLLKGDPHLDQDPAHQSILVTTETLLQRKNKSPKALAKERSPSLPNTSAKGGAVMWREHRQCFPPPVMSFPAPTLTVRSGFSWWGVGGDQSLEATGYFDRKLGARLMFSGQRQLLRTGKVERSANVSHNRTEGAPVAVATWACYRMPSGRTLGFPRCQPLSVHAGVL